MTQTEYVSFENLRKGMIVAFDHPEWEHRVEATVLSDATSEAIGVRVWWGNVLDTLLPGSVVELISKGDSRDV